MKINILYSIPVAFALVSCQHSVENAGCLVIGDVVMEQSGKVVVATRSVDAGLVLEIKNDSGVAVREFAAGDEAAGLKIELDPGNYTMRAHTADIDAAFSDGEHGTAKYDASCAFSIEADRTRYVNLSVPMVNFGVQLILPDMFADWFDSYRFSVSASGRSVDLRSGETAFFDGNDVAVSYSFSVTNKAGETSSSNGTIEAGAGCIYQVLYELASKSFTVR